MPRSTSGIISTVVLVVVLRLGLAAGGMRFTLEDDGRPVFGESPERSEQD